MFYTVFLILFGKNLPYFETFNCHYINDAYRDFLRFSHDDLKDVHAITGFHFWHWIIVADHEVTEQMKYIKLSCLVIVCLMFSTNKLAEDFISKFGRTKGKQPCRLTCPSCLVLLRTSSYCALYNQYLSSFSFSIPSLCF